MYVLMHQTPNVTPNISQWSLWFLFKSMHSFNSIISTCMSSITDSSIDCSDEIQEEEETGRLPEGQIEGGKDEAQS